MFRRILIVIILSIGVLTSAKTSGQNIARISTHSGGYTEFVCDYFSLDPTDNSFELISEKQTPAGWHFTFQQQYKGHNIVNGLVRFNYNLAGDLYAVQQSLKKVDPLAVIADKTYALMAIEGEWVPIKRIELPQRYMAYVNPLGQIVKQWDGRTYHGKDTSLHALVFKPNPLISAQKTYGAPYADFNDSAVAELDAERVWVEMPALYRGDSFVLANEVWKFVNVSDPLTTPATAKIDTLAFSRKDKQFEEVNVFYHLSKMKSYLENRGFSELIDSLDLDAHALFGTDNSSYFRYANPPTLEFGDGGVDDAEDAEVIIHEFSHAMSELGAPNTYSGRERESMDEGTADYFAKSYSRQFSDFRKYEVFTWDGHNSFWEGYSCKTDKKYPDDIKDNTDNDREIWSTSLVCILDKLGRETADTLILSHLFMQMPDAKMPEMAQVILQLDTQLYQAQHADRITDCFNINNILSGPVTVDTPHKNPQGDFLLNTQSYFQNKGPLVVNLQESQSLAYLKIYNSSGQLVFDKEVKNGTLIHLDISSGVYVGRLWYPQTPTVQFQKFLQP